MLTDRQRVESGIIPALIYGVCHDLKDLQETAEQKERHAKVVKAAFDGMVDAARDLDERRAGQILRRSERAYLSLADVIEGASNAQAMMATYYLLEELLQEERLTIYEGSDFAEALQIFMEAIDQYWDEKKLDQAAQKRARKMRDELKRQGYFR